MKIQTLSVLCGTAACNARCPFCVSKMTYEGCSKPEAINTRNFEIACRLAERAGVTTAMLTGKGEPTLWPEQIGMYLYWLDKKFPFIELQTNGIRMGDGSILDETLTEWWNRGLTTICLSVVHWDQKPNHEIYLPHLPSKAYPPVEKTIARLHRIGFSVRLNCIMLKGQIDNWAARCGSSVRGLIDFAKEHKVEQLTLMPVKSASRTRSQDERNWALDHELPDEEVHNIRAELETHGHMLMDLAHGARVFDYHGQNVCLSNCLTKETYTDSSTMRNLIFFPDGHLRYDWEYQGAILL